MDLHRINLEEFDKERFAGQWVDIKTRRSYGDSLRISAALFSGSNGSADFYAGAMARLDRAIEAWSEDLPKLPARDPERLSPERQVAFAELDEDLGVWMLNEINARYEAHLRSEADTKGSGPGSARRTRRAGASRQR